MSPLINFFLKKKLRRVCSSYVLLGKRGISRGMLQLVGRLLIEFLVKKSDLQKLSKRGEAERGLILSRRKKRIYHFVY